MKLSIEQAMQEAANSVNEGEFERAVSLYKGILLSHPNHAAANHNLGALAVSANRPLEALRFFAKAVRSSPAINLFITQIIETLSKLIEIERTAQRNPADRLEREIDFYKRLLDVEPKDRAYQLRVWEMKHTNFMEFPAHVHLETLAKCNAACSFCPYPEISRQGTKMSDELIEKVISDLEDIPVSHTFQLSPFKVNEPFLDNRLFDIMEKFDRRLPNAQVTLTTNATPLTEQKLVKLSAFKRIGYLWISFNDHRPDEYEKTMQLPYRRTIERLDMIHQKKAEGLFDFRVVLSRVGDGSQVDTDFRSWVAANYPLFEHSVFAKGQWLGQVESDADFNPPPNVGCTRWFDVSITSTGVVAHCCMDGNAEHPIGDVKKQHVLEIYNLAAYKSLRQSTISRLEVSPCKSCSFL